MKKLIHRDKSKLKEKAKTLIIFLLFFLCLTLGYRILRLYNAQSNVESALWGSTDAGYEVMESGNQTKLSLVHDRPYPSVIMANTYSARRKIEADTQEFAALSNLCESLINDIYNAKNESVLQADLKEWQNALNSDSVYFRYPIARRTASDAALFGNRSTGALEGITIFTDIIVAYDKNDDAFVSVYIAEQNEEKFLKVNILGDSARAFKNRATKLDLGDEKTLVFAWELNLDKKSDKQMIALDSMLLIPINEEKTAGIRINIPKLYKTGLEFTKTTDLILGLVDTFGYNPNTIRRYVGKDNSIMCVGETGSLNLYPDGLIEYKALDADDGLQLSSKDGFGDIVFALCSKLERIMRISGVNAQTKDFDIRLTSMPRSYRFDERGEIQFDYFAENRKVELKNSQSIVAVIESGRLVELKMPLADIEVTNKQSIVPDLLETIDEFYANNFQYSRINDAYIIYKNSDADDITAEWKIEGAR